LEIGCGIACLSLPIIKYIKQGKYYGLEQIKPVLNGVGVTSHQFVMRHSKCRKHHFTVPCEDNELDTVYSATIFLASQLMILPNI